MSAKQQQNKCCLSGKVSRHSEQEILRAKALSMTEYVTEGHPASYGSYLAYDASKNLLAFYKNTASSFAIS